MNFDQITKYLKDEKLDNFELTFFDCIVHVVNKQTKRQMMVINSVRWELVDFDSSDSNFEYYIEIGWFKTPSTWNSYKDWNFRNEPLTEQNFAHILHEFVKQSKK